MALNAPPHLHFSRDWVVLAEERYRAEIDLLGAVLADPAGGMLDAADSAVSVDWFIEDDSALVYATIHVQASEPGGFTYDRRRRQRVDTSRWSAAQWREHFAPLGRDRDVIFALARRALVAEGHWDSSAPADVYGVARWSDARLAALFGLHCFGQVPRYVAAMLEMRRRQRGALAHWKQMVKLLRGEE